jgi:hypothetical protein
MIQTAHGPGGDLFGPSSASDNGIPRFDGTSGKLLQGSTNCSIGDSGNVLIGTTTPSANSNLFMVYQDTAGSGTTELVKFNLINSSTLSAATNMVGLDCTAEWTGNKNSKTMNVYGLYGAADVSSDATSLTGCQYAAYVNSGTLTQARGDNPLVVIYPTGTVTTADVILGSGINMGTVTTFYGNRIQLLNSGTVTTAYGFYANFTGDNDPTTTYGFYGNIAKGTTKWGIYLTGDVYNSLGGGLIVNEGGNDSDTRIEGDTDTNLFFVDAGVDRVGIGENAPDYKLDVNGSFGFTPGNSVTPVDNGDVTFSTPNNTTLRVSHKGNDGVVRTVDLTLT